MSLPHVRDAGKLAPFLKTSLQYRSTTENGGVSEVERLAPTTELPLRFSKVIKGSYSRLITYENQMLIRIKQHAPDAKIVKRLDYHDGEIDGIAQYSIVTVDAGVDLDKWFRVRVQLIQNNRTYPTIFNHPSVLLRFTRSVMVALESIHRHGIVHCDIKADQICIPFEQQEIEDGVMVTPYFDKISLIDFGLALWEQVPIASSETLPLPTDSPASYQALNLINALVWQAAYYKKHGKYSFNDLIKQVNYSTDLYSFGFLLKNILEQIIQRNIIWEDIAAWATFQEEFVAWVNKELLNFKIDPPPPYNRSNRPHDGYIKKIDDWIQRVEERLTYKTDQLSFIIKAEADAPSDIPEPTPTPRVETRKIQKDKEWLKVAVFGLLVLVIIIASGFIIFDHQHELSEYGSSEIQNVSSTTVGQFTVYSDGTAVDNSTGLRWSRCRFGQTWHTSLNGCSGKAESIKWSEISNRIEIFNSQTNKKWRLPTILELNALLNCKKNNPILVHVDSSNMTSTLNSTCMEGRTVTTSSLVFPSFQEGNLWSSTLIRDYYYNANITQNILSDKLFLLLVQDETTQ